MPPAESIALFIPEIEAFGGAERSVLALSRWLHEHGRANHILVYEDRIGLTRYVDHPMEVVQLNPGGGVRSKVRALRAIFASSHPRPIASGYQPSLHLTLAGVRGFHCLMHDTPALFGDTQTRSWKGKLRIAVSNRIVAHGLKSGGVTTVNSEFLREECGRDFGIDAKIVRMGGLASTTQPRIRHVDGQLRMLSVCRIEENKRIDWLLQALAEVEGYCKPLSARVDWHLDLVGKGSLIEPLAKLANELGIGSRVHFHGFVADSDLERYYDAAHLFVMPAVQGYGIPALEALQRGLPVMLHRDSGVSDILLETPWATVMRGSAEETARFLSDAIESVLECRHCDVPPPPMPTEESWAQQVATLFAYGAR